MTTTVLATAEYANTPQGALFLAGIDNLLLTLEPPMWCGFCGDYLADPKRENCDCAPTPLCDQSLDGLGVE